MTDDLIYMDHHATTPVDPAVFKAMEPYFSQAFGNAASRSHAFGLDAKRAVDKARKQVARLLGCKDEEIVFTSGATESDNLAIKGVMRAAPAGSHLITQQTEHSAVLDSCARMEEEGHRVTYLPVDNDGRVDLDDLKKAITDKTALISIMLTNNEVGTVQDVQAIAKIANEHNVLFHCDASQGLGYIPLDLQETSIDLLSLTAHKLYGPKGTGALFVRKSVMHRGQIQPLIDGGGHENGLRSGTLAVANIVGFGEACALMHDSGVEEATRLKEMSHRLRDALLSIEETRLNGSRAHRHPGNVNISFGYLDGAKLLLQLSERLAVSSGSACSSASPKQSHVLKAMHVSKDWAQASIRFGLGRGTTVSDIDTAIEYVTQTVKGLREGSPQWEKHQKQ